jgi:hypothetical protein
MCGPRRAARDVRIAMCGPRRASRVVRPGRLDIPITDLMHEEHPT